MFSYHQFHIFDKSGTELPLNFNSSLSIAIPNKYGDDAKFFGITDASLNLIGFHKISSGGRFDSTELKPSIVTINGKTKNSKTWTIVKPQKSTEYGSHYISGIDYDKSEWKVQTSDLTFPSLTFDTNITFDKVSTELVETQSLYFLVEMKDSSGNIFFDSPYNAMKTDLEMERWCNRFKILIFIDCRDQKDFRVFDVDTDEAIWSDRKFMDLTKEDGFRVNIGFSGEHEGVYEQPMYVCLVDTATAGVSFEGDPGYVYPIGEIKMAAETEGEDERYRAFFENFGIPDPATYNDIFNDFSSEDDKTDYTQLNRHSKKVFLSYSEIFPYAGSYKALINAVHMLGYDDIFFKEWYKEIGKTAAINTGYVTYDISYKADPNANIINNLPLEERVQLKKLNWLSMMYHLNEEISADTSVADINGNGIKKYNGGTDRFGFPETISKYNYYNTDNIAKLISLRKWLEKYITGLNCRIIDVGGEGIYFERYRQSTYGTYQSIRDVGSPRNIAPLICEDNNTIYDGSAYIGVCLDHNGGSTTFEDLRHVTYENMCDGYINSDGIYVVSTGDVPDASVIKVDASTLKPDKVHTGPSIDILEDNDLYSIKVQTASENFIFANEFIDASSPRILISGNSLRFNPSDLLNRDRNTAFTVLPIIQLERANIRKRVGSKEKTIKYKIYRDFRPDTESSYIIEDTETRTKHSSQDYITFIPPLYNTDSSLYVKIKPVFSDEFIRYNTRSYYHTFDNITVPGETIIQKENIYKNVTSYGLRYADDIGSGDAANFMMVGYNLKDSSMYDTDVEYILEIFDGKMLFDDPEHDRKIYLNFSYDDRYEKYGVTVNSVYEGESFFPVRYMDVKEFLHFVNGKNYSVFAEKYRENPESAVFYNDTHRIKVYNAGEYDVNVRCSDSTNTIYSADADRPAVVLTADPEIKIYSNFSESDQIQKIPGIPYDASVLSDKYTDFCIYDFRYPTAPIVSSDKEKTLIYAKHAQNTNIPSAGDIAHLENATAKFRISGISKIAKESGLYRFFLTLNREISTNEERFVESFDKSVIQRIYGEQATYKSADEILSDSSVSTDLLDVNIIFYNELGNYPIMQVPGKMMCPMATGRTEYLSNTEYHLYFEDSSTFWNGMDHAKDIMEYINKPYVSAYIQPLWEAQIKIKKVDLDNNILYIQNIENILQDTFKPGEIVRIKYEDATNPNYYSYAVYKVIDYDILGNMLRLQGNINKAYVISEIRSYIYAEMDMNEALVRTGKIYTVSPDEKLCWRLEGQPESEASSIFKYFDPSTEQTITYEIEARYKNSYSVDKIIYRVGYFKYNKDEKLIIDFPWFDRSVSDKTKTYISYAHHAYVDYPVEIDSSVSINKSGNITVHTKDTPKYRSILYYIDDTFALIYRHYDINNGIKMWMPGDTGKPLMADSSVFEYSVPVSVTDSSAYIAMSIDSSIYGRVGNNYTVKWTVYRRIDEYNNRDLLFESYNNVLFLNITDAGIYDILVDLFDEFGNISSKLFNGIIKICRAENTAYSA